MAGQIARPQAQADRGAACTSLAALPTDANPHDDISAVLERLTDLSDALRDATTADRRLFLDAFDLRVIFDKIEGRIQISATITEPWPICSTLLVIRRCAVVYSGGGTRTHNQSVNSRLLCH